MLHCGLFTSVSPQPPHWSSRCSLPSAARRSLSAASLLLAALALCDKLLCVTFRQTPARSDLCQPPLPPPGLPPAAFRPACHPRTSCSLGLVPPPLPARPRFTSGPVRCCLPNGLPLSAQSLLLGEQRQQRLFFFPALCSRVAACLQAA